MHYNTTQYNAIQYNTIPYKSMQCGTTYHTISQFGTSEIHAHVGIKCKIHET